MRIPLLILAVAGTLVACGTAPEPAPAAAPTSSTSSTSATTATTPAPPAITASAGGLTPQGFLPKVLGQVSGLDCDGSIESCQIKFTVDKIDINPACQTNSVPPAAGNKTVVLTVSMTTGTLSETGAALVDTIWNPTSLKSLSPDGSVADAVPGRCLSEAGKFPFAVLPNAKHTGTVEVEVPESATSIASTHPVREDGGRGWVWPIG